MHAPAGSISVEELHKYLLSDFERPALAQDAAGDIRVRGGPRRSHRVAGEEVHEPAAEGRRRSLTIAGRTADEYDGSVGFP